MHLSVLSVFPFQVVLKPLLDPCYSMTDKWGQAAEPGNEFFFLSGWGKILVVFLFVGNVTVATTALCKVALSQIFIVSCPKIIKSFNREL